MNKINTFESSLAIVKNALGKPTTQRPPIPKDRAPRVYQTPQKNNSCIGPKFQEKTRAIDKELSTLNLWKSMIMMLANFIERSPGSKEWKRSELKNFISQMEICLEIKPGKLSLQEYSNLVIKLDAIVPFKDGELTKDLETIDQMVQAYGDKLAQQNNKI